MSTLYLLTRPNVFAKRQMNFSALDYLIDDKNMYTRVKRIGYSRRRIRARQKGGGERELLNRVQRLAIRSSKMHRVGQLL